MRLLIIEDDRDAADYPGQGVPRSRHMSPTLAYDGEDGLALTLDGQYDVLIVDRWLPKLDGLTVDRKPCVARGSETSGAHSVGARPGRRPR